MCELALTKAQSEKRKVKSAKWKAQSEKWKRKAKARFNAPLNLGGYGVWNLGVNPDNFVTEYLEQIYSLSSV